MSTADLILDFANSRNSFTLCELAGYVHEIGRASCRERV